MSLLDMKMFKCDRCGVVEKPRDLRGADDDGFPHTWAHVVFKDSRVSWDKDLCSTCADEVGQVIRRKV